MTLNGPHLFFSVKLIISTASKEFRRNFLQDFQTAGKPLRA